MVNHIETRHRCCVGAQREVGLGEAEEIPKACKGGMLHRRVQGYPFGLSVRLLLISVMKNEADASPVFLTIHKGDAILHQ